MKSFEDLMTDELAEALHFASEELWAGGGVALTETRLIKEYGLSVPASSKIVKIAQRMHKLSEGDSLTDIM